MAATKTATRRKATTKKAAPQQKPEPTGLEAVTAQAERVVLVPVGAALIARDGVVDAVKPFRTRTGAGRELKRFERRGTTARNKVQREVKRTRTRVERELRQRRRQATQAVKRNRRNLETQVKQVRKDVEARAKDVRTNTQDVVKDAREQVGSLA
jgi:ElaB/YqjD/DUF883 family membrane-anchored ribosome-binding protein